MAVTSITTSAFTEISDGTTGILAQFRAVSKSAGAIVQVATEADPSANDWLEFADGDTVQLAAGDEVHVRAVNGAAIAVTREIA